MARSFIAASSQYILVNSAPSINLGTEDFTVAIWVRFPTTPPDDTMIIGKREGGWDGDTGWELKWHDTAAKIRFDIDTDTAGNKRVEADITNLADGNWHLLAGVRDADLRMQLWSDGIKVGERVEAITGSVDTTTPLVIGAAYDTPSLTNFIDAEFGPIFICRRALSEGELVWLAKAFSFRFLNPAPCFLMELISRAPANEPDIGVGGLVGGLGNSPAFVDNPRIIQRVGAYVGQDLWYERLAATISGQSAVSATIGRLIAAENATIAAQSAMTATLSANVAPKAAIAAQSSVSAQANITASVGANISAQSGMSAALNAKVPVSTGIVAQSAVSALASPAVGVTATVAGQSALSATGDRIRTLSTSMPGQSALSAAATIKAGAAAQLDGQSGLTAFLTSNAPVATVVSGQSNISAQISALTPAAATIAGQSALTAKITRARPAVATIAGQSALTASGSLLASVRAAIAGQSALTATTKALVPVAATIAGQSALAVLPSFPGERKTITVGGYIRWLEKAGGQPI